jgi:hypothetical protein
MTRLFDGIQTSTLMTGYDYYLSETGLAVIFITLSAYIDASGSITLPRAYGTIQPSTECHFLTQKRRFALSSKASY